MMGRAECQRFPLSVRNEGGGAYGQGRGSGTGADSGLAA
jgi:hypothetical protein